MKYTRWRLLLAAGSMALAAGCGDPTTSPPPPTDAGDDQEDVSQKEEAAVDSGVDARADARPDAQPDAKPPPDATEDAAPDATEDASPDATIDAADDATPDVGLDATPDVGLDASPDVAPDAIPDAAPDATPDAAPDGGAPGSCATPRGTFSLPSATPVMITGTTMGGTNQFPSTRCQSNTAGADHVYTLVVTARTGVVLSTDNAGTAFDTELSIRRTCADAATELSCDDDSGIGTDRGTSSVLRAVLDPGTYAVILDGYNGQSGAYTLTASTFTPAANATCATATTLTPGTAATGQALTDTGAPGTCAPGLRPGGQLFYAVTLPASTLGTVQLSRASGSWDFALRVYADCDTAACLLNAVSSSSPLARQLVNGGSSPRRYVISVASDDSEDAVTPFDIVVNPTTLTAGQACESAQTLTPGTPLTAQSTMGASVIGAPCRSEDGGQRFYSVTIPAGQRVRVTATPTGTARQPVLRVLDGCGATACLDNAIGGTSTTPAAASVDVPNSGTAPRAVIVSLASPASATPGTWDLAATLSPLVAGQFCAEPAALAPGVTLSNQDAATGLRPSAACSSATVNGGQLFYRVTVPATRRVVVRAVPAGAMASWTPTVRVLATCTSTSCADSSTAAMAGGVASVTLSNGTAAPRDFLLSVAGPATSSGTFNLEAGAATVIPGYTSSPIMASCDDVSSGTAATPSGGWDDDTTTAIAMLPFTVPFFGVDQTRWSANSNGLLQLYPMATGSTSTEYSNTTIPSTGTPNGFVAAFWDDLRTVAASDGGTGTGMLTATLGAAPNRRFVVQWTDFTLPSPDNTARLTFQVKLFETTNVIEVHYCAVTAGNARASGNSATVGVEDPTGASGTEISYLTADAARTGFGWRLTPR
ncbi:MAG: hypothetical protein U0324_25150 [Polyangiales bacterium]